MEIINLGRSLDLEPGDLLGEIGRKIVNWIPPSHDQRSRRVQRLIRAANYYLVRSEQCIQIIRAVKYIQRIYRGYLVRRNLLSLSLENRRVVHTAIGDREPFLRQGYKAYYIIDRFVLKMLPRGPHVLEGDIKEFNERFASRIQNSLQLRGLRAKDSFLVVPRARLFVLNGDIVQKVPILNVLEEKLLVPTEEYFEQCAMHVYCTNAEKFTNPVLELLGLAFNGFCIDDLTIHCSLTKLATVGTVPIRPRYDNYMPYLDVHGKSRIGMLDLEFVEKGKDVVTETILDLVFLFPYHCEKILAAIVQKSSLLDDIPTLEGRIKEREEQGGKYFKVFYLDHKGFIEGHEGIPLEGWLLEQLGQKRYHEVESIFIEKLSETFTHVQCEDIFRLIHQFFAQLFSKNPPSEKNACSIEQMLYDRRFLFEKCDLQALADNCSFTFEELYRFFGIYCACLHQQKVICFYRYELVDGNSMQFFVQF